MQFMDSFTKKNFTCELIGKTFAVLLLLLVFMQSTFVIADANDPYGNLCVKMDNKNICKNFKPLSLFVDALHADTAGRNGYLDSGVSDVFEHYYQESKAQFKKRYVVGSVDGLKEVILKVRSDCYYIKELEINGHGYDGAMVLETSNGDATKVLNTTSVSILDGLSCIFGPDARISLWGCNTAKDIRGEFLLKELGKRLLWINGGSIMGADGLVAIQTWFNFRGSLGGYNTFLIGAGGINQQFNGHPVTLSDQIKEAKATLNNLELEMKGMGNIIDKDKYDKMISYYFGAKKNLMGALKLYEKAENAGGLDKLSLADQSQLAINIQKGYHLYTHFRDIYPSAVEKRHDINPKDLNFDYLHGYKG